MEGHGYSAARHDVSDLAALTAQHPWLILAAEGVAGVATIAFGIWQLRPALDIPGRRTAVGVWLFVGSLMALDNVTDIFFRLDCREADPGCTLSAATVSWHGKLHIAVGMFSALLTVAAPFVLARRMRLIEGWHDLATPTIGFGVVFLGLLVGYSASDHSSVQGYLQRAMIVAVSVGVTVLALRAKDQARGHTSTW